MNFKAYIDYFDEISHLKREQQFTLLEQAYNEASAGTLVSAFTLVAYLIPAIFILFVAGLYYVIIGYSVWLPVISFFVGLLLARIVVIEINDKLMAQGLKKALEKQSSD